MTKPMTAERLQEIKAWSIYGRENCRHDDNCSSAVKCISDLIAEIERLQSLTNTITPVCIYCFKKWKTIPNDDVDAYTAMVPDILAHVSVCEKNPLVQEIERLRRELKKFEFIFSNKRSEPFRTLYDIAHKALEGTDAGD